MVNIKHGKHKQISELYFNSIKKYGDFKEIDIFGSTVKEMSANSRFEARVCKIYQKFSYVQHYVFG